MTVRELVDFILDNPELLKDDCNISVDFDGEYENGLEDLEDIVAMVDEYSMGYYLRLKVS